jgi:hypothetical protein
MDYTERPDSNQSPDETLFNFLADLYGIIGGPPCQNRKGPCNGLDVPSDGAAEAGANGSGEGGSLGNTDDATYIGTDSGSEGTADDPEGSAQASLSDSGENRSLREVQRKELPSWLVEKWQSSVQELIQSRSQRERGNQDRPPDWSRPSWRFIQNRTTRSIHEIDLGQNYRLQVHFLKVVP